MANRIYTPKSNNTQGSPPKPMHSVHDEHDTSPDTAKRSPAVSAVQDVGSREATELEQLPITASGESVNVASPDLVGAHASAGNTKTQDEPSWKVSAAVSRFWKRQISIHVPHEACRDHWANERTYLGYLRTSITFAIQGILIAQLFHLQHTQHPNRSLGFYVLGVPLSAICLLCATLIACLGGYRFWRNQNAMARGKANAGGWEIYTVGMLGLVTSSAIFVLTLAINVDKELLGAAR